MNVLVYDDRIEIAEDLAAKIRTAHRDARVTPAVKPDLERLIEVLRCRRAKWRDEANDVGMPGGHPVDEADLVVVDYDLFDEVDTTGSQLAYWLRCFSGCGFIAILNGNRRQNVFDASLCSPIGDFADLHISDIQIGNPGLWRAPFMGYRPWYWPVLPIATREFKQCVNDVRNNIDEPILPFLGLEDVIDWIPQRAREFLTREPDIEGVTFRGFVESVQGGIAPKDEITTEQLARVAAARIRALLNSLILPEQSVLIDAPHLVSRFPSLIAEGRDDINQWNRLCDPVDPDLEQLLKGCLEDHRFEKAHWLSRPAWYWPTVKRDNRIEEVNSPWTPGEDRWVFCENISRFTSVEFTQAFRAIVSPPFMKRFVFMSDSPGALEELEQSRDGGSLDSSVVEYVPQANFSV